MFDRVFLGVGSNGTAHLNENGGYYGPSVCLADSAPITPGSKSWRAPRVSAAGPFTRLRSSETT